MSNGLIWRGARHPALRWGGCMCVVLALHAAALLSLSRLQPPPGTSATSDPVMLELAPMPAATPAAVPVAPASEPPPPRLPPPEPPRPTQEVARSVRPEPDAILPLPPPPKPRPRPLRPHPAVKVASRPMPVRSTPAPAAQRTAVAAPATVESASASASSAAAKQAARTWEGMLLAHIARFRSYPSEAQRRGWEGVVLMRFTLDRAGGLVSAVMVRGSGHEILDEAAQAWLRRAAPMPPPPPSLPASGLSLLLPMRFSLAN